MSLRQMEYLLAVVEEGSFTQAAERLSVSQPTLSHQIRALERSVGQPLLERLQGTVRLTPMGRAYLPRATFAVRSAREAWNVGRLRGEPERIRLRIATLASFAVGIIPTAIQRWRRAYPNANVELLDFVRPDQLVEHVALGRADVAVSTRPQYWDGPVRVLGTEKLVVVLAADDPLAGGGREKLPLAQLADRAWVLYDADNPWTPVVAQACAEAGFTPRAAVRTHHPLTAIELARAGLGPALAPWSAIEPDFAEGHLLPEPSADRELVAFTPPHEAPPIRSFVEVLARVGTERRPRPPASG
jgi:DNA-binding transcriptional LysR family regulator